MKLLVLGGTRFLGRALVEAGLARGDEVTLFNRGRTNPALYPQAEKLRGDRSSDLSALERRAWDVVIDVAAYQPSVARRSAEALRDRAGRYAFVSSVYVYADQSTPPVEDGAVAELAPADSESDDVETYGARKAASEAVVADVFGAAARGITGTFNATGESMPFQRLLEEARAVTGNDAHWTWIASDALLAEGLEEWMGVPLWIASPGWEAAGRVVVDKAVAAGLTFRPLAETIAGTLAEAETVDGVRLDPNQEHELLVRHA